MRHVRDAIALTIVLGSVACTREHAVAPVVGGPHRIVALTIGSVDTLALLGELDRVIAVEEDCFVPGTEKMVKIKNDDHAGPSKALNVEAVLALQPDLVIAKEDLRPALGDRGIDVLWTSNKSDLPTVERIVQEIGDRVGVPDKARAALAQMHAREAAISKRVANLSRVKVYYESGRPGRTSGRDTIVDEMIRLAGGVNIAGDQALANPQLSAEAVVAANPDVIVLSPWGDSPEEVMQRPGWNRIAAVREKRVHRIAERDRKMQYPSPSCVDGCEQFLVPWLHPELDETAEGKR